ncbi:DUF488 domain-containing protein [Ktedonobacter robiniae]|uniref:DUF488 domain-containing protein n=1 Tax=Ktedonobacter robiniae TaxID=2778365 RepID=A0ABQ3UHK2_9CHLR|nr:DUF488 domain-containing protein [Ktedonobacter robiniae]GHO52189.1 hypothetical protein KSB_06640 [Ktedonobacter robiniae]
MSEQGTLYTLGYAHPETERQVHQVMRDERALLVDIRLSPYSKWASAWNKGALCSAYGSRYVWDRRLGNVNYAHKEQGIQLAPGHEDAVREVASWLREGRPVVLLCACRDARTCHRSLIAKLVQVALLEREDHYPGLLARYRGDEVPPVILPEALPGMQWFSVALWTRWPDLLAEHHGYILGTSAFNAIENMMRYYRLSSVARAAAHTLDFSIFYRCARPWILLDRNEEEGEA